MPNHRVHPVGGKPAPGDACVATFLTVRIYSLPKEQGVTQIGAAKLLSASQTQISALMRCRPVSASVGRLMEFLTILGQDVGRLSSRLRRGADAR